MILLAKKLYNDTYTNIADIENYLFTLKCRLRIHRFSSISINLYNLYTILLHNVTKILLKYAFISFYMNIFHFTYEVDLIELTIEITGTNNSMHNRVLCAITPAS